MVRARDGQRRLRPRARSTPTGCSARAAGHPREWRHQQRARPRQPRGRAPSCSSAISALVTDLGIDFIKWDHNRDLHRGRAHATRPATVDAPAVHAQTARLLRPARRAPRRATPSSRSSPAPAVAPGSTSACSTAPTGSGRATATTRSSGPASSAGPPCSCRPELMGTHIGPATAHTTHRTLDLSLPHAAGAAGPRRPRVGHHDVHAGRARGPGRVVRALPGAAAAAPHRRPRARRRARRRAARDRHGRRRPAGGAHTRVAADCTRRARLSPGLVPLPGLDPDRTYAVRVRTEAGTPHTVQTSPPAWWDDALRDGVRLSGAVLARSGAAPAGARPRPGTPAAPHLTQWRACLRPPAPAALPRILSGMQPTSDSLHLGNYLGALVNWVGLQDDFDAYYFVADLHALTVPTDPEVLRHRTRVTAAQFLAGGVDPQRSAVFCQSHVTEHAELGWVMTCLTGDRRGQPDDAVQGQDGQGPERQRRPVHLPDADGGRHPHVRRGRTCRSARTSASTSRSPATWPSGSTRGSATTLVVPEPYILKGSAKIMDLQDPTSKMSGPRRRAKGLSCSATTPAGSPRRSARPSPTPTREVRYDPETKPGVSNLLVIHSVLSGHAGRQTSRPSSRAAATATSRRRSPRSSSSRRRRSRSGWPSCSTTRPSSTGSSPTAPTGRARSPGPRWPGCADRGRTAACERSVGSLPVPTIGVVHRDPRRRTRSCCRPSGPPSATRSPTPSRRTSPCCRPPTSPTTTWTAAVAHLEKVAAAGPSVRRWCCAAPGTFRPVSPVVFVQVSGGMADCELLERAVRARAAGAPPRLPLPPARHGGPPRAATSNLDRAFNELADFECTSRSSEFHLYEHGDRRRLATGALLRPGGELTPWRRSSGWWARLQAHARRGGPGSATATAGATCWPGASATSPSSPSSPRSLLAFTVFGLVLRNQPQLLAGHRGLRQRGRSRDS